MKRYYQIANLWFTIEGDEKGGGYKVITDYFKDKECLQTCDVIPMLNIEIAEDGRDEMNFKPECYSLSKRITFNHDTFHIKKQGRSYSVKNLFKRNKPTDVVLYVPSANSYGLKSKILGTLLGTEVCKHDLYSRFALSVTDYSSLWYIFAITLMKCSCVFVHSGMLALNNKGIVLSGTGGCGKTSTMMELVSNGSGYQYISEDFGIISSEGKLFDMQKKAAIYSTDVKWGNPILVKAINNLPSSLRREWNLKIKMGRIPVHHFSPKELFGDKIAKSANIEKVFFLRRVMSQGNATSRPLQYKEIAERIKNASFRELKELYEILCNIRAVGGQDYWSSYPSIQELESWYMSILEPVLEKVPCYELILPSDAKPNITANHIISL